MNWNLFQIHIAAFCAWREASGEGSDGLRGVLHVIKNRALKHRRSWAQIVFQYLQFSSMTAPGDPQIKSGRVPTDPDVTFVLAVAIATDVFNGVDPDITNGATNYFADSIAMPVWAKEMTATARIGKHSFYMET